MPEKARPKDPNFKSIDIMSMFDVAFMEAWGMNSEEYDCFCEHSSEEENDILYQAEKNPTFTNKRKALEIVHKYKKLGSKYKKLSL